MAPLNYSLILLLLLPLLLLQSALSTFPQRNPRLSLKSPHHTLIPRFLSHDFKSYNYTQTLDHFNFAPQSYATFRQRYFVNSQFWGGPSSNSPIFAYLGAEQSIDVDMQIVGFLNDSAPRFKSLSVFIEHRFYGESIPSGSMQEAMNDTTTRGYFSSAQALADYAEILLHVKKENSAHDSPIIVVGGSYGGMLASWFRLKYPHITLGALASSAPVLYFDNITPMNGYYSLVTKDFKEVSESCYEAIRISWGEIDKAASQLKGLSTLSRRFKTCAPLKSSAELKYFLNSMYSGAAQYDSPPRYPVSLVCKGIDGFPVKTDVLGRIFAGVVSLEGNRTCYDMKEYSRSSETSIGWGWQTCSEIVMPIGRGENDTMFPAAPFDLDQYSKDCKSFYGVPPRPHWITTYYGGENIKSVLKRFGSNIIYSNGLRDPYSSGGVLEDISESIVAVTTRNGSHCLDLLIAHETDPKWLVEQRKTELDIIEGWLKIYYNDLHLIGRP